MARSLQGAENEGCSYHAAEIAAPLTIASSSLNPHASVFVPSGSVPVKRKSRCVRRAAAAAAKRKAGIDPIDEVPSTPEPMPQALISVTPKKLRRVVDGLDLEDGNVSLSEAVHALSAMCAPNSVDATVAGLYDCNSDQSSISLSSSPKDSNIATTEDECGQRCQVCWALNDPISTCSGVCRTAISCLCEDCAHLKNLTPAQLEEYITERRQLDHALITGHAQCPEVSQLAKEIDDTQKEITDLADAGKAQAMRVPARAFAPQSVLTATGADGTVRSVASDDVFGVPAVIDEKQSFPLTASAEYTAPPARSDDPVGCTSFDDSLHSGHPEVAGGGCASLASDVVSFSSSHTQMPPLTDVSSLVGERVQLGLESASCAEEACDQPHCDHAKLGRTGSDAAGTATDTPMVTAGAYIQSLINGGHEVATPVYIPLDYIMNSPVLRPAYVARSCNDVGTQTDFSYHADVKLSSLVKVHEEYQTFLDVQRELRHVGTMYAFQGKVEALQTALAEARTQLIAAESSCQEALAKYFDSDIQVKMLEQQLELCLQQVYEQSLMVGHLERQVELYERMVIITPRVTTISNQD